MYYYVQDLKYFSNIFEILLVVLLRIFQKYGIQSALTAFLILGRKHVQNYGPLAHQHSLQGPKILCYCSTKATQRKVTYISTLDTIEHFQKCLSLGILATRPQAVQASEPESKPKQKVEIEHVGIQLEKVATLPHRCSVEKVASHLAPYMFRWRTQPRCPCCPISAPFPSPGHTLLCLSTSSSHLSITLLSQALIFNLLGMPLSSLHVQTVQSFY